MMRYTWLPGKMVTALYQFFDMLHSLLLHDCDSETLEMEVMKHPSRRQEEEDHF